ncbi:TPA: hypothetical protein RPW15_001053 [Campylobacter fetus subsp. venerealis]|uniref:Uncharacterized protein n=1 Tax=Campylobacter fetus subsp. venerealis NCTC 10354 TaxID=983328 RepID=A0AAE6J0E6_CAMFE|nr:hypothetical protein [Campylobacter fetus]OCS21640.1 hypothetical protein CFVI97532_08565 [Campylobacter fetus subsp. venerealis cfvi97/532]OCS26599.1 hypothetical protein CFVB10_03290 [Campylobacter fetus subsp. venerealis cfvB10]OCS29251.1 hypothetical protein CFVCCUG33900_07110 [Campylobacter fetus subsp. venerealis LMG 6570 = CCUG 33900]OCS41455.1 hypothetical protein CFVI02298_06820 [Campylobacter fetus subsp. venerealis cfvi02/298]AHE94997.1 hypothetical protein CFVI03293_1732 [Campyl
MKTKHIYEILSVMLNTGEPVTATDFKISNANQYFVILESMRLVTRVKSKEGNFKVAYFKDNEQKQKARDYLSKCGKSKNLMSF